VQLPVYPLPEVWFFAEAQWYTEHGDIDRFPVREGTVATQFRRDGGLSKLDCFVRFDEVNFWLSRTRDLIADAGSYSYPAFRESFRELRREGRKSEIELVITLFKFERAMRGNADDADKK
jgi:hypothetical protein